MQTNAVRSFGHPLDLHRLPGGVHFCPGALLYPFTVRVDWRWTSRPDRHHSGSALRGRLLLRRVRLSSPDCAPVTTQPVIFHGTPQEAYELSVAIEHNCHCDIDPN